MHSNKSVEKAISLLEKITGKRVILEFPDKTEEGDVTPEGEDAELQGEKTARQKGAEKAMKTKGYQNWTPEQYALCYFLKKYGKVRMPMPYKTMTLQQFADEMNAKQSTLGMNGENIKFLLTGKSSLESAGPKAADLVAKFEKMNMDQVWRHARRAFEQGRLQKQIDNDPRLQGKTSSLGKTYQDYTPEIADEINRRRAARGESLLPGTPADKGGEEATTFSEATARKVAKLTEAINKKRTEAGLSLVSEDVVLESFTKKTLNEAAK